MYAPYRDDTPVRDNPAWLAPRFSEDGDDVSVRPDLGHQFLDPRFHPGLEMAHASHRLGFQHEIEFVLHFVHAALKVGHTPFNPLAPLRQGEGKQPLLAKPVPHFPDLATDFAEQFQDEAGRSIAHEFQVCQGRMRR